MSVEMMGVSAVLLIAAGIFVVVQVAAARKRVHGLMEQIDVVRPKATDGGSSSSQSQPRLLPESESSRNSGEEDLRSLTEAVSMHTGTTAPFVKDAKVYLDKEAHSKP